MPKKVAPTPSAGPTTESKIASGLPSKGLPSQLDSSLVGNNAAPKTPSHDSGSANPILQQLLEKRAAKLPPNPIQEEEGQQPLEPAPETT